MQKLSRRRAVDHLVRTDVRTPYACVRHVRTCRTVETAGKVTIRYLCRVISTHLVRHSTRPLKRKGQGAYRRVSAAPHTRQARQGELNARPLREMGGKYGLAAGAIKQYMDKAPH